MSMLVHVLNIGLPFAYLATLAAYGIAFSHGHSIARRLSNPLLVATLVLHALYLLERTLAFQHPPITSIFEILSLVAFAIAVSYAAIEYQTGITTTGGFIIALAFLFQTISSLTIQDLEQVPAILRSNLLGVHVTSAMLGLSAFAISFVYGALYLVLYHHLKAAKFGLLYDRLPNLEELEKMTTVAIVTGFLLLTVAIAVGLVWLSKALENASYADPKLVGTIIIWLLYGVGLLARTTLGWHGRKLMLLSVTGFLFSLLSLTVVNVFFSGFHKFY